MSIRELFRHKLENAEIIPDSSMNSKLMRKLARREFLRFNPARFNVYYLGAILISAVTAGIILFTNSASSDQLTSLTLSGKISKIDSLEYLNVPADQTVKSKNDISNINTSYKTDKKVLDKQNVKSVIEPVQHSKSQNITNVTKTAVTDSFAKKGLFTGVSNENNQLQSVQKTEKLLFETSTSEGCIPLKIRFINKSNSNDSCMWSFGDGGYSYEKSPEWIFDVEGEYKVILQVFGPDGLKATSSSIITVYPKPLARYEIAPEKAIIPEDEVRFYNYSTNAVNYKWDFGDGITSNLFEPRHKYSKFGNYNVLLVASSDYGCSDSLTVSNAFSGSEYFIDFPNAFIPNSQGPTGGFYSSKSDEGAQVFHPVFSGVTNYQLKIFSKRNVTIFESSDINIGWDGYYKGQLCDPGVYIWKVRGNFRNGEPFIKMGDLTLLRN